MIAGTVQMFRNSGDKALKVREAVTDDDHTLGGDFIFADVLAMNGSNALTIATMVSPC